MRDLQVDRFDWIVVGFEKVLIDSDFGTWAIGKDG